MAEKNYIYEYYQKLTDGSITAGKWVHLVYKHLVDGLENKAFFYDQKKASSAIKFIQSKVHHTEGKLAPGTLRLELWQKALISAIFGIVDEEGLRQFREVFIVTGRKNGKSLLGASLIEQLTYNDNEYGAKTYCVAPKVDQANIVFNAFWQSVQLDSELKRITKSRKSDVYVQLTNSSVQKLAMNSKASDGFNPHAVIMDEISSWPGDKGLKQYEVMASAIGSREQPLLLAITTAGYVHDGIYDELMNRSTRLLLGDSKERRLLPVIYQIDDIDKWNDINELAKANPNLGVSLKVDYLLEQIAIAEQSLSKKNEFMAKFACIKQSSSQAWLSAQTVQKACGPALKLEDFRRSYAVGGIDLSQTTDLTACTAVIERERELYVFAKFFLPRNKIEEATERDGVPYNIYVERGLLVPSGEDYVDYTDCYNWFIELVQRYEILPLKIGYDRYSTQYLVKDLAAFGFHCDDVYQGDNLYPLIQELEGKLKAGEVHIGDNDLLKICLLNSAVKMSNERNRGRLVKITPNARIDGTAALLDALAVRSKYYGEIGGQLMNVRTEE